MSSQVFPGSANYTLSGVEIQVEAQPGLIGVLRITIGDEWIEFRPEVKVELTPDGYVKWQPRCQIPTGEWLVNTTPVEEVDGRLIDAWVNKIQNEDPDTEIPVLPRRQWVGPNGRKWWE